MDALPPRWVRRIVLTPLAIGLCLVLLVISPFVFAVALIVDLVLRRPLSTVRLVYFLAGYVVLEIVGLVAMFVLWIRAGFGFALKAPRVQDAHYRFMRWWLMRINKVARRAFHLDVSIEDPPTPREGPILVFCRHAGPGNSLLLIGTLLIGYRRRPRIVMLNKLQWEPLYDVMLNRLPNKFIKHDPKRRHAYIDAIGELATGLGPQDAFVLFPEGKDFTPRVRRRAIDYLRTKGHDVHADRAEKMEHVLPPRHNGVMAAMQSAPEADVVLVAHSVLEDVGSFKELWGRIPFDHSVCARYWRIPPGEIPQDEAQVIGWLYDWWERIDGWISARKPVGADERGAGP
jgi:hypothetical protein